MYFELFKIGYSKHEATKLANVINEFLEDNEPYLTITQSPFAFRLMGYYLYFFKYYKLITNKKPRLTTSVFNN